jgi:hypothetical protein
MDVTAEDYRLIGDQINTNHINWLSKNFYQMHGHGQIWGDEANWTKYHAACWNALRNDNWTNMGFSPKAIALNGGIFGKRIASESEFAKTTSAYSALVDLMALGGRWANPMQVFDHMHVLSPEELGFTKGFLAFWYPMMNQLGAWMNCARYDYIGQSHPFETSKVLRKWDLASSNDDLAKIEILDSDVQDKWQLSGDGIEGDDSLHLHTHSLKPLRPSDNGERFERNYKILNSIHYSEWAYRLLNVSGISEPTLVRVNVEVHFSMEALTTLGHFLLSPGRTPGQGETVFPVQIRYVNDFEALRMLNSGKFQVN